MFCHQDFQRANQPLFYSQVPYLFTFRKDDLYDEVLSVALVVDYQSEEIKGKLFLI